MAEVVAPPGQDSEPYLVARFLPRCANCHLPHPLARMPKVFSEVCPDCGTPSGEGYDTLVKASLGGVWGLLAKGFLSVGRWLRNQSRKV